MYAQVAQSAEQKTENLRVGGSIPSLGIFLYFPYLFYIFSNLFFSLIDNKNKTFIIIVFFARLIMNTDFKNKIEVPKYSLGEELMSSISHGIGILLSILALILCISISTVKNSPVAIASSCVYGLTLFILYTMSTIYHALKVNDAKRILRIIDHCSIYLLIAGSYTPYMLVALDNALGWSMFGVVWGASIVGIVFNAIDLKKYKIISIISYLILGWMIVFTLAPLCAVIPTAGIWLLVSGGICYTVGAIFYGIGKKIKYMHSIFHVFVLAGSICQFFSIYLYVL